MSDWKLSKKKISKRTIDLESEFVGKSVGRKKKKDPEPDLTDRLRDFLSDEDLRKEEIFWKDILLIILRMTGEKNLDDYAIIMKFDLKVFFFRSKKVDSLCDFLIWISPKHEKSKFNDYKYYLNNFDLIFINSFRIQELSTSSLRNQAIHVIRKFFYDNITKCIELKR